MVWIASGERQVAELVTPMTSAFDEETESARSFQGFWRAVPSTIWTSTPPLSK
jgi:hypothetical protein